MSASQPIATQPLRIFFPNASILYPPTDGPHIHQFQLIKNLIELGHQVVTLTPDKNPLVEVRPKTLRSVFGAVRWADAIYCRTNEGLNAATRLTTPAFRWMIPRRCPVIWQMDLDLYWTVSTIQRNQNQIDKDVRQLGRRAARVDAAIAVTQSIADQAKQTLKIPHCFAIPNGSDPQLFYPAQMSKNQLSTRADRLQAAWIGSHSNAIHDATLVASLCRLIDQERLPIDVHVMGRTQSLFSQPYPDSMVMHGPVSYLELPGYLSTMDVGMALYNIRCDGGSPLKLFDYMASGCVPICSPGLAMDEVLAGQDAGYVADWTARSLADRLMTLRSDRGLLGRMSRNARKLIEDRYSWRKIAEKTEKVIQEAIERRKV